MIELSEELQKAMESEERDRLEAIIQRGDPGDFDTLENLLMDEEAPETYRRRALYALGVWPDQKEQAVEVIQQVLPDLNEVESITALSTLGRVGTPRAQEIVLQYRQSDKPDLRRQVVKALDRIGTESAVQEIRTIVEQEDLPQIREYARKKLRKRR